jgi:hypothetical protein
MVAKTIFLNGVPIHTLHGVVIPNAGRELHRAPFSRGGYSNRQNGLIFYPVREMAGTV